MKLLNGKTFILSVAGFGAVYLSSFLGLIRMLAVEFDDLVREAMNSVSAAGVAGVDPEQIARTSVVMGAVLNVAIVVGLSVPFIVKAFAHRKTPKEGKYLTVLMVFAVIFAAYDLFSLFGGGSPFAVMETVVAVGGYGCLIAGVSIQKSALTPFVAPPPGAYPPFNPYAGNPYAGNPYQRNPNANPYQQNPYAGNPYRQNPDAPPSGANPVGANPAGANPGENPSGSQYGDASARPQNPFGEKYDAPEIVVGERGKEPGRR